MFNQILSPKQQALIKQFLFTFSGLLLAVLLILSSWYNVKSDQELKYQEHQELNQLDLHETSIFKEYETTLSDLLTLASLPISKQILSTKASDRLIKSQLTDTYLTISQTRGRYDQIRYLNNNGQEVIRINFKDGIASVEREDKLQNKADRYYVQDIASLNQNDIYVSRMDLNIDHGQVERPFKPIIRVGMHLFDANERPQGMVIMNYFGQRLLDALNFGSKVLDSRSSLMLLDHDGYWLKGPDKEKEWGFMFDDKKKVSFANEHPKIWQQILRQKSGQIRTPAGVYSFKTLLPLTPKDLTGSWHYDFSKTYFKTQTKLENYQWILVSFLPASQFYTDTHKALQSGVPYLLVGLVFLSLLSFYLATYHRDKQYLLYKTHYMAFHDELTGLFNRHVLDQKKGLNMVLPKDKSIPYAVFFFDLDGFKPINDKYGHHIGDEVLKITAKRLQGSVREHDVLIRLGGDEFALIAPKLSNKKHAAHLGEKLLNKIQEPIHIDECILQLGVSIGIAMYPSHHNNLEKLIDMADDAMYAAKQSGKGRICFPENAKSKNTDT